MINATPKFKNMYIPKQMKTRGFAQVGVSTEDLHFSVQSASQNCSTNGQTSTLCCISWIVECIVCFDVIKSLNNFLFSSRLIFDNLISQVRGEPTIEELFLF